MGRCNPRSSRALVILSALVSSTTGFAADVRIGGVRLEVPAAWSERTASSSTSPGASERLWVLGPAAAPMASLLVATVPSPTEVSPRRLAAARLEVERCSRERAGHASLEVDSIGIRGWRDGSGYEIAATSETGAGTVRHLQYLLQGRGAVVVTLSTPADRFESLRPELERIAGSLVVEESPSTWDAAPRWLCGAILALLLGLCATSRACPARLFG